jgi:hypothetical protein
MPVARKGRRCIKEIRLRVLLAAISHGQASNNNAVPHRVLHCGFWNRSDRVVLTVVTPISHFTRTAPVIKISHDSDAIHDNNKQQHPIGGKEKKLQNYVMRDE